MTTVSKTKLDSKVFKSFISNSMILKICELEIIGNIFDNPELLKGSEENG